MNAAPDPNWQPDPQLLAAFFDGELEGRDDLADLRARLETWLESHPDALSAWHEHQRLQQLWTETIPAEPASAEWNETLTRIEAERRTPRQPVPKRRPWLTASVVAGCALLAIGAVFGVIHAIRPPTPIIEPVVKRPNEKLPAVEVFEVAIPSEIVILRVEGEDTGALVVGRPPVVGPLELAESGDIVIVRVRPDARDNMMPFVRHQGPNRPMVSARLASE